MQNYAHYAHQKKRNRFSEMKSTLPTISERSIAKQLDELEKDGIITRKVFAEVPLHVEYYLTEYGKSLYPIIREIRKWGYKHLEITQTNQSEISKP